MKKTLIKAAVFTGVLLLPLSNAFSATTYCDSQGNNTNYEWIESIAINGNTLPSGNNNGYFEHSDKKAIIHSGSNTITLNPGFESSVYSEKWRGWLDIDGDNIFSDSELIFEYTGNGPKNVNYTLPENVSSTVTTLRVAMQYGSYPEPCGSYTYGETEDIVVSIESEATDYITHHLNLDYNFTVHRNGELGEGVMWAVEKDGKIVLQRNAATELEYFYYLNSHGSNIRIWLQRYLDGAYQQVSNVVEYTPGTTDLFELNQGTNYQLQRSGVFGDSVQWVIEKDGVIVLERNAENELDYTYFSNTNGSQFRVWLKQFINGEYKVVSNTIEYEVGNSQFSLTVDQSFELSRTGMQGDQVQWVIEKNGSVVLERNAENELNYTYFSNTPGALVRVWLQMFIDGSYQIVSNVIEYQVPASLPYTLSVDGSYQITRTGNLGDNLTWVIVKDGNIVLQRNAANELSYKYYINTSGSNFEVYLHQFIDGYYQIVSNTVQYSVP